MKLVKIGSDYINPLHIVRAWEVTKDGKQQTVIETDNSEECVTYYMPLEDCMSLIQGDASSQITGSDLELIAYQSSSLATLLRAAPPQPDSLDEQLKRAAQHVMTPEEKRAQRLSFIRGQTGHSDELILSVLPELTPVAPPHVEPLNVTVAGSAGIPLHIRHLPPHAESSAPFTTEEMTTWRMRPEVEPSAAEVENARLHTKLSQEIGDPLPSAAESERWVEVTCVDCWKVFDARVPPFATEARMLELARIIATSVHMRDAQGAPAQLAALVIETFGEKK